MAPVRGFEPRYAGLEAAVLPLDDTDVAGENDGQRSRNLSAGDALFCRLNYVLESWITGMGSNHRHPGSEPGVLPLNYP